MSKENAQILKLLEARDPEFLHLLFQETNPYLFRFLGAQKVFGSTAEDLIQESWLTFFERLDRFEGRSQIRTFLAGILLNKLRERRRLDRREQTEPDPEKILEQSFTPDGWWASDPADPQALRERKELGRQIAECLEGLTPDQKAAFQLREIEDEPSENICKILGVTVSHLGVLIFRAKDKLRKCLDGKQ